MYELTDDQLTLLAKEDHTTAYVLGTLLLAIATGSFGASSAAHGEWFGALIAAGIVTVTLALCFFIQSFWKRNNLARRIDEIKGISSGSSGFRLRLPWTFD